MKNLIFAISIVALVGCQTRQAKIDAEKYHPPTAPNIKVEETPTNPKPPAVPQQVEAKPEKFGIIFSAGGVRTWSYINLLKEMQKYKMPIASVAGVEWGAVVAGVYAENISANEVEWELSKFKSLADWESYIQKVFEKKSANQLKIPFGCTSLNLKNQTAYVLTKGNLDSLIPLCVAAPGVTKPYTQSIAAMTDISPLVQFLKSSGATIVILVNGISSKMGKPHGSQLESLENQFWIQAASGLKKINGVDEVIEVDVNTAIENFDQRRAVLSSSIPQAKDQLKRIANKYGF